MLWRGIADKFKLEVDFLPGGAAAVRQIGRLATASTRSEPSWSLLNLDRFVTHPLEVRKIMDRAKHPALLMVDTISGSVQPNIGFDAWGIDVSVASQKG